MYSRPCLNFVLPENNSACFLKNSQNSGYYNPKGWREKKLSCFNLICFRTGHDSLFALERCVEASECRGLLHVFTPCLQSIFPRKAKQFHLPIKYRPFEFNKTNKILPSGLTSVPGRILLREFCQVEFVQDQFNSIPSWF